MVDYLSWRVVLRPGDPRAQDIPGSVLTVGPQFHHESMPDEVGMLLPTNHGPTRLIDDVVADPTRCRDAMLGLFLANPFLNVTLEGARLRRAGVEWIVNLPSVAQQDDEFSSQLPDVGLDPDRERDSLARFRDQGFRITAVVADGRDAAAAAAIQPDAILVLPRVGHFAAGFPSLRQRSSAAQSVAEAVRAADWTGILLGLGESRELDSEGLWASHLDGLVCRPSIADAAPG
ncbi:MAG: hypothetical protein WAL83_13530 [Arenicellales bacterium]